MIKEIGHNGSEIIWPNLLGAYRKRAHHIQEIQECFIRRGYCLYPIQFEPILQSQSGDVFEVPFSEEDFLNHIKGKKAILAINEAHCVAWDGKRIHDPAVGRTFPLDHPSEVSEAWIKAKLI